MSNRGFWVVALLCIITAVGVTIGVMVLLEGNNNNTQTTPTGTATPAPADATNPTASNTPEPNPTAAPTAAPTPSPEPSPTPTPEPTPEPTPAPTPPPAYGEINVPLLETLTEEQQNALPWHLKLANPFNALPPDWTIDVRRVEGYNFDVRAADALEAFMASSRANSNNPILISAFRDVPHQTRLFNNRVQRFINEEGLSPEDADAAARRIVAYPGTSEHNLGLAVDIVCSTYHGLTDRQGTTPNGRWMAQNAHHYGFILRYPAHKTHITHIIYEPWHFRYVGKAAAYEIFRRGLVLEEFLSELFYYDLADLDLFR